MLLGLLAPVALATPKRLHSVGKHTAQEVVDKLGLIPNPEKGYFIESFRDPDTTAGNRSVSTAIYYLLESSVGPSIWHRVDAAEVWHYYAGAPLTISLSYDDGNPVEDVVLGPDVFDDQRPQYAIAKNRWQRATSLGRWTLVGTTERFVAEQLPGRGPATYVDEAVGSFNLVLRFSFAEGGDDVALRMLKPGHTPSSLVAVKTADEVAWMRYLKAKTTIPIPRIHCCSSDPTGELSPLGLSYILMDFFQGTSVREFLQKLPKLGVDADADAKRSTIFEQAAEIYLQLYRLRFDAIGSIAEDPGSPGGWRVTERPLTSDMLQFALGIPDCPTDHWPEAPLRRSDDYFDVAAAQHRVQLWYLRNLNLPHDDEIKRDPAEAAKLARFRFKAQVGFEQLIPVFHQEGDRNGPFGPFNPDLDPRNMVLDPDTLTITGVFDFEFTNAMPAQFARDPPPWLVGVLPATTLDKGFFPWFLLNYKRHLDVFLDAMRRAEARMGAGGEEETPLSEMMLESFTSHRCWFNYAANNSGYADALYWSVLYKLHPEGSGGPPKLTPQLEEEMERYVEHTRKQLAAFEEAWVVTKRSMSNAP
ncbi:phosphotransferase enzyme family protein [Colletotrichum sojae]|uniref:Phosphotransferase enzyme family protein n=1 Tax=Colletotrichum sojae TaxID=2175907 RepID=A0A8H6ILQ1_9PEZI|nr:phosphotransferase enzyme family protein [Colletotrichum sojae]